MTESGLEELKSVARADVYKDGALAAHLIRTDAGAIEFRYTEDWVEDAGPPVATTLPVTPDPVGSLPGAVPPFFAGLLPEGRRLTALRQSVKTSADDELTQLLAVGTDTVGDVQVVPAGEPPHQAPARLRVASFAEASFAEILGSLGVRIDRVGLPGVQDKVSAAMLNVPITAAGAHTLLKLNPAEYPSIVENEAFFLAAARKSGITAVEAEVVRDRDGLAGLAVARFDRVGVAGRSVALPVEDGCQVLGLYPSAKYSVTTERMFAALSAVCEAPIPAAAELVRQMAFAFLSGNGDAHAKNFSVMRGVDGRWQPTPAYDLPSSYFYGDPTMALTVDGRRDGNITGARFVALGEAIGLRPTAVRRLLEAVAGAADGWLDGVAGLPYDKGLIAKYRRVVANRQRMLRL